VWEFIIIMVYQDEDLLKSRGCKPRKGKVYSCKRCGKKVYRRPCKVGKFKNVFCSRKCHLDYMKENAFRIKCVICGKERKTQPSQVKYRNARYCSRKCQRIGRTREAEERIKNGDIPKSVVNRRIRYSKKMDEWRKAVFERDNYTCQICGARSGNGKKVVLNADHIKSFAKYSELRFDINNGRTLCLECHMKTPSWGNRKTNGIHKIKT